MIVNGEWSRLTHSIQQFRPEARRTCLKRPAF